MLRFAGLVLSFAALAPLSPFGCPPAAEIPDELEERGTLPVTASGPAQANVGEAVQLSAAVEDGSDDGTITYRWAQSAGAGVDIQNATQPIAQFQAPSVKSQQMLKFVVTARNAAGHVGRAEVGIDLAADPDYGKQTNSSRPVANAGSDFTANPNQEVVLDGSRSTGKELKYRWQQISGRGVFLNDYEKPKARFTCPTYSQTNPNFLLFELTVTSIDGQSATDRVQVTIRDPNASSPRVKVDTTLGAFTIELRPDKAPVTVENFLRYVDDKFYDGTIFHRVIKDFVIQGGGFTPSMREKDTRDPIKNEANNGLTNARGTVAMARTDDPDSATSQFFVNLKNNNKDGDGQSNLDPNGVSPEGYAVFGSVVEGMDIVDKIGAVRTGTRDGYQDVPTTNVVIRSIRRLTASGDTSTDPNGLTVTPPSNKLATPPNDLSGQAGGVSPRL